MYLEISTRRTGKTSRLIEYANNMQDKGMKVVVSSFSRIALHSNYKKLTGNIKRITNIPKYFEDLEDKYDPEEWFVFYDEVDLCKNVLIQSNGYYVSTPRRLRTLEDYKKFNNGEKDILLELLQKNEGQYTWYNWSKYISVDNMKDMQYTISNDIGAAEFSDKVFTF